jgi:hypothetical protein
LIANATRSESATQVYRQAWLGHNEGVPLTKDVEDVGGRVAYSFGEYDVVGSVEKTVVKRVKIKVILLLLPSRHGRCVADQIAMAHHARSSDVV